MHSLSVATEGAGGSDHAATTSTAAAELEGHYSEVAADAYEKAFFYSSSDYRHWVMGHVERYFRLPDTHLRIVDLGGGTGNFWEEHPPDHRRVLCVDASREMLQKAAEQRRVEPMLADAGGFAALPPSQMAYDRVLLKELVHHLPPDQIRPMYAGLYAQLAPGGVAVTITRPQEVDYPLFARARQIWKDHQPHHSVFVSAMEAAGFDVEVGVHEYPASLPKATWLAMMRSRFWSTFSYCSDAELEQGIAEVDAQHAGQDTVRFVDRLLFLVGRKGPRAGAASGAAAAEATAAEEAPPVLSPLQVVQYHEQGFCGPVDILTPSEAAAALARFEEYERLLGGKIISDWRFKSHLLLPWMWDLAHHPRLVAAVSAALGGVHNLLCWSSDIFVKDPGTPGFTSWHQDSTYVHLDPADDVITAWLALTPSGLSNGCLRFRPGSHKEQLPHVDTRNPNNMLLKGQAIIELEQQQEQGVHVDLRPGQASLHHIRAAHASGPAAAGAPRRVGIAFRYMAAHVRQGLDVRDSVTVVSGQDTFGLYHHERHPSQVMGTAEMAEHKQRVGRVFPDGYEEQRSAS